MSNLDHILSHTDCLTQEQLMQYAAQRLSGEAMHDIESHLIDCDFCSDALEGLQMLSVEESQEHLLAIQTAIESELNLTQYSPEKSREENISEEKPVPLNVKKGGKRISWAAVAGIFFLVFGGGLVVFSYINNNTTWFDKSPSYSKNGDAKSKEILKEPSVNSSPEYGNVEINTDAIEDKENIKETKLEKSRSSKKEKPKKEPKVKEVITGNQVEEQEANDFKRDLPSPAVAQQKTSPKPKKKALEVVAQNDKELEKDFGNISTQNTYSQDRYEGKMKNKSEIGNVQSSSPQIKTVAKTEQKKGDDVSIGGGRSDETVYVVDGVQIQSKNKKKYVTKDNLSQANEYFAKADYKQSIKYYKKVLRQQSVANREEVLYKLALAYENTGNNTKAEKIYAELSQYKKTQERAQSGLYRIRKARSKK